MKTRRSWSLALAVQVLLLLADATLGICVGSTHVPLRTVVQMVWDHSASLEHSIVVDIRLPRVLLAVGVGGGLSLAGVLLQGVA